MANSRLHPGRGGRVHHSRDPPRWSGTPFAADGGGDVTTQGGDGMLPAESLLRDLLGGRIDRREFMRRAAIAGMSAAAIGSVLRSATAMAQGTFDPMKYAGTRLSVLVRSGEWDETGLQDKIPEI